MKHCTQCGKLISADGLNKCFDCAWEKSVLPDMVPSYPGEQPPQYFVTIDWDAFMDEDSDVTDLCDFRRTMFDSRPSCIHEGPELEYMLEQAKIALLVSDATLFSALVEGWTYEQLRQVVLS